MTKKEYIKYKTLIEAWSEGKEIEHKSVTGEWHIVEDPIWSINSIYRIKPSPKLVPFDFSDDLINKVIILKHHIGRFVIIEQVGNGVQFGNERFFTYKELLEYCYFNDGTACGKYDNE